MKNRQISNVVDRLIEAVESENHHLRSGRLDNLDQFVARKNHALVEFSRAVGPDETPAPCPGLQGQIAKLKQVLTANESLLQIRAEAVRELSRIVRDAMRAMESDGTYSGKVAFKARPR